MEKPFSRRVKKAKKTRRLYFAFSVKKKGVAHLTTGANGFQLATVQCQVYGNRTVMGDRQPPLNLEESDVQC
jgi:hypothetical protein